MTGSFYLDEDVSVFLVRELERRGHFATSTRGERRLSAPDSHHLLFAAEQVWVIVTHNRHDFRLLHDAWLLWSRRWGVHPHHSGILVLDQYERQTAVDVANLITALLDDPFTSLESALYDWQRPTGWVRFPG
jgi:hypothetical protein